MKDGFVTSWKLFIDDERSPEYVFSDPNSEGEGKGWTIARTSASAIALVKEKGMPQMIAFDHDLGTDDTSVVFLKWLIDMALEKGLPPPKYSIHSQNPVGRNNIVALFHSWKKVLLHNGGIKKIVVENL